MVKDDNSTTGRAANAAHETVDKVADRAEEVEERIRKKTRKARDGTTEMTENLCQQITDHPLMSIGIAFGVGYIVSGLMRR